MSGSDSETPVLVRPGDRLLTLILNRPLALNTLTLAMVRRLRKGLELALKEDRLQSALLLGAGERGFSAGGDLKALAAAVQEKAWDQAEAFFREEYALDLFLNRYPKPVVVLADGISMGGGLGLAAEADLVIATERSRLAMPETRIGFFPDVGATGWLFQKCPPGYPEFLALTGYEMAGAEGLRLGLATHLTGAARLPEVRRTLENLTDRLPPGRPAGAKFLAARLAPFFEDPPPARPEMDAWVAEHFADKASLAEILASLNRCRRDHPLCAGVFQRLAERSPTALALTLRLLRLNQGRPLKETLAAEFKAARFIIRHPDYLEGIRARILDKDDHPRWRPASLDQVRLEGGLE
jgi:enoyl-CoA hydratase